MSFFAKLNATGYLSDIRSGSQQPNGVWPDGSQDVPLASLPAASALLYTYDTVNLLAVPHDMRPRTLLAIYTDLAALTSSQKLNVWADLSAGSPAKYLAYAGPEPGAIAALDWAVRFSGLGAVAVTDAKLRIAAIYVQGNPLYLVAPAFDPSINVPGAL